MFLMLHACFYVSYDVSAVCAFVCRRAHRTGLCATAGAHTGASRGMSCAYLLLLCCVFVCVHACVRWCMYSVCLGACVRVSVCVCACAVHASLHSRKKAHALSTIVFVRLQLVPHCPWQELVPN